MSKDRTEVASEWGWPIAATILAVMVALNAIINR